MEHVKTSHCEGGCTLGEVAKRSSGISNLGNIQNSAGHSSEQSTVAEPAFKQLGWTRQTSEYLLASTILWFCESWNLCSVVCSEWG